MILECVTGDVIDSGLTMSDHVTAVCRSAYYQLRQLRTIVRSLSDDAAKTLVQAFISCRLDYCNALLCGISDGLVQRLQSYKMRQLGWSLELVDESTSRRC